MGPPSVMQLAPAGFPANAGHSVGAVVTAAARTFLGIINITEEGTEPDVHTNVDKGGATNDKNTKTDAFNATVEMVFNMKSRLSAFCHL